MKSLNLTQHQATQDQLDAGVVQPDNNQEIQALLNFETLPTLAEIKERAEKLAEIAGELCSVNDCDQVMIGGAPFLMAQLEYEIKLLGFVPVYAFSVRESVESVNSDGTVTKVNKFKHSGFIAV